MLAIAARRLALATMTAALVTGGLSGCSDDDDDVMDPPSEGSVMFQVRNVVGGDGKGDFEDLVLDQMGYTTEFGNTFSVSTLLYYISDIRFNRPDADPHVSSEVRLVDAGDPSTLSFMIEGVEAAHYHTISVTFGVPEEINDNDLFERGVPPHVAMEWPDNWGGGYHYMKLEGAVLDEESLPQTFRTHTGRFDDGNEGPYVHTFTVDLEAHMDVIANETTEVEFIHNVKEWYEDPNVIDLMDHTTGIMANKAMQDLLEANGPSTLQLGDVSTGGHEGHDG